jgi:hypothetical protein
MMREWRGVLHTLVGFENSYQDGTGMKFNFILSNGTRSAQRDGGHKYYDFMIPKKALDKIRSVTNHYHSWIAGFLFFDKDGALLWKHGSTTGSYLKKETVLLEENEVIVGVVAKLLTGLQSAYTDF